MWIYLHLLRIITSCCFCWTDVRLARSVPRQEQHRQDSDSTCWCLQVTTCFWVMLLFWRGVSGTSTVTQWRCWSEQRKRPESLLLLELQDVQPAGVEDSGDREVDGGGGGDPGAGGESDGGARGGADPAVPTESGHRTSGELHTHRSSVMMVMMFGLSQQHETCWVTFLPSHVFYNRIIKVTTQILKLLRWIMTESQEYFILLWCVNKLCLYES